MSVLEATAYSIALKTLRERCKYLQEKLELAEDENYKLKLQISQETGNTTPRTPTDVILLQEQLGLVSKQKLQLSNQLQMVAGENRTLWSRLSKLTVVNQNLGNRLSMISETLNRHDLNVSQSESELDLSVNKNNKESLEEISLKLIQGILQEKTELENQYAQMVDLQNDNESLDIQNFGFSFPEQEDNSISESISKHVQKLNQFKLLLTHQKSNLENVLVNMKNLKMKQTCPRCITASMDNQDNINGNLNSFVESNSNNLATLQITASVSAVPEVDTPETVPVDVSQDKICPMCGETFKGSFMVFQEHVTEHFAEEEEHFSQTFEIVP